MKTLYIITLNKREYFTTDEAEAWGFCLTFGATVKGTYSVTYQINSIETIY